MKAFGCRQQFAAYVGDFHFRGVCWSFVDEGKISCKRVNYKVCHLCLEALKLWDDPYLTRFPWTEMEY